MFNKLSLGIVVVFAALLFWSCTVDRQSGSVEAASTRTSTRLLPSGATRVRDVGNDWRTFWWEGRKFLYRRSLQTDVPVVMVELSDPKKDKR